MEVSQSRAKLIDFHLFFERPPVDQSDRWSGRPFRAYSAVNPQFGGSLDEVAVRQEKLRFLQNLWSAQAMARAKLLTKEPSAYKSNVEVGLEAAGELFGRAACFWSLWQRPEWDQLSRKVGPCSSCLMIGQGRRAAWRGARHTTGKGRLPVV
jgi:hypothetical protein